MQRLRAGSTAIALALLFSACGTDATTVELTSATSQPVETTTFERQPANTPSTAAPVVSELRRGSIRVNIDAMPGILQNGNFVPEFDQNAMQWQLRMQFDEDQRYAFGVRGGVAEPGDRGCGEMLQHGNDLWTRSTEEPDGEFEPNDTVADFFAAEFPWPATGDALYELLAVEAPPFENERNGSRGIFLDQQQFDTLFAVYPNLGGIDAPLWTGADITSFEDADGTLSAVSITTFLEADNGDFTTYMMVWQFDADVPAHVTSGTPWAEAGGCQEVGFEHPG